MLIKVKDSSRSVLALLKGIGFLALARVLAAAGMGVDLLVHSDYWRRAPSQLVACQTRELRKMVAVASAMSRQDKQQQSVLGATAVDA